ncbi:carbamoyltransferase N-terminal domain-containing protein [Streptomyces sp. H27-C3]|uniref:carbamoyltransferase N-terminal domain-containing protein n=1 Tax=Streptomyces sp. H27-C3 TaxID=3046305 RepID=UPI0024B9F3E0|nr:carbamoyltransferase N-terminal domain-containing protein [Streptomyces sp. H27-C3]MDJ0463815.1 carbamoyltransferase N-terminal domain-containing protein [Streptomyces sp. H27-C3]
MKLTHDGAVALLDDERLVFSVEMEKLGNALRYSTVGDFSLIPGILADFGYKPEDVDEWVIDGWDGDVSGTVALLDQGRPTEVVVGPYRESQACPALDRPSVSGTYPMDGESYPYTSYPHAAGHVASAYVSSPFAQRGESSFVLVWDGGLFPRLYWVDPDAGVENLGELFPLLGHAYAIAGHHFGPFRRDVQSNMVDDLSIAGKLMAYIALGQVDKGALAILREEFHRVFESDEPAAVEYRATVGGYGSLFEQSVPPVHEFYSAVRARVVDNGVSDEDALASVHAFFEGLLVERITAKVRGAKGDGPWNLCFAGGCALNIKWNSALREAPDFSDVWVPPFPNDSGSAIGAAALGRAQHAGMTPMAWNPRLGPALSPSPELPVNWSMAACTPEELARILHESGEPVVVLHGRAELGPRALGGRSILAAPVMASMKDELNRVKDREPYRPIAPICLEGEAPAIFSPGTPDPHMLFDHEVRADWRERIPAVIHLDGTARLQTVGPEDDSLLFTVLSAYHRLSGVPVLCNTSANLNGHGFFPNVASAAQWGRVSRIWSAGTLYQRTDG